MAAELPTMRLCSNNHKDGEVLVNTKRSSAWLVRNFWSPAQVTEWMHQCKSVWRLEHHPLVRLFGNKQGHMRRSVGFFSDESSGYKYTGQTTTAQPLTDQMRVLLAQINTMLETDFNGILVNWYADGTETIGAHSDDERELAHNGMVACLSLGAERILRFRAKPVLSGDGTPQRHDCVLPSGSLLVMDGAFQHEFTHEVPKQTRIKEPRLSLTFRTHRDTSREGSKKKRKTTNGVLS